jgi:delta24(24(1))-sterol reductase
MSTVSDHGPAGNLRKRKSVTLNSEKIASGNSTAMMKINAMPTEHGQEMDKKLDEHQTYVGSLLSVAEMLIW